MKVSEFLGEARDELYKGWTQRAYRTQAGSVCAVGAIERVALRHLDNIDVAGQAQDAINKAAAEVHGITQVRSVNDRIGTTKQDILDLFDKTIIGLEETGR
jgi:hypothetical protein